ncbi:hypothetical protein F5878DRAFT_637517 [Lentinula raphanica]|uniref:Uncharacterized protein n=1 Tax=Lentinula raphanica TaxID=153919 RepID=A0AA38PJN7_9AGAR|nr:hypothetical protein F5878DRAFT_637517 [Lentinula raphanica]
MSLNVNVNVFEQLLRELLIFTGSRTTKRMLFELPKQRVEVFELGRARVLEFQRISSPETTGILEECISGARKHGELMRSQKGSLEERISRTRETFIAFSLTLSGGPELELSRLRQKPRPPYSVDSTQIRKMCRYVCKAGAAAQGIRSGFWAKSIEVEEANNSSQISTMPFSRSITSRRPFSRVLLLPNPNSLLSSEASLHRNLMPPPPPPLPFSPKTKTAIFSTKIRDKTLLYIFIVAGARQHSQSQITREVAEDAESEVLLAYDGVSGVCADGVDGEWWSSGWKLKKRWEAAEEGGRRKEEGGNIMLMDRAGYSRIDIPGYTPLFKPSWSERHFKLFPHCSAGEKVYDSDFVVRSSTETFNLRFAILPKAKCSCLESSTTQSRLNGMVSSLRVSFLNGTSSRHKLGNILTIASDWSLDSSQSDAGTRTTHEED